MIHSKALGDPPTTYVNATLIRFKGVKQTFIATQAPKPNSFQNFWQMVLEKKVEPSMIFLIQLLSYQVRVIVSITGLKEGSKKKADKYWPDEESRTMDLGNSIKLEYRETSYQGTYYRRFIIFYAGLN